MNERELKYRFWQAVCDGSIGNNDLFTIPRPSEATKLHVVEEAEFRNFDLLIASIGTSEGVLTTQADGSPAFALETSSPYYHFAIKNRCRIDKLSFFPVELKSDNDVLDERLARQVANALFAFGNSIVVFDQNHSKRISKSPLVKALPSTLVTYSEPGGFEVLSKPILDSRLQRKSIDKRKLAALLMSSDPQLSHSRVSKRLELIELILNKVLFNQHYFSSPGFGLSTDEICFLASIMGCSIPRQRRMLADLIRETSNSKLTDYIDCPNVDHV